MWLQLWQLAKLLLFLATCWNIGFFEIDVLNCMIFCNWLSKCVTASPKIEKIHTFFRIDFLKFAIFVYIGHVNTQLFLWKPVKTACFLRRLLNMHRWAIYIKKVYYVQYTDTHKFLLKICNIHILWEFWKMHNIQ